MASAKPKEGLKAAAHTNVHIAVNMLEEALGAFGSESDEGGTVLKALHTLRKLVGKRDSSDLVPAEIAQMVSRMPQMGGGTDLQRMLHQMMMQPPNMQQRQPPMPAAAGV